MNLHIFVPGAGWGTFTFCISFLHVGASRPPTASVIQMKKQSPERLKKTYVGVGDGWRLLAGSSS